MDRERIRELEKAGAAVDAAPKSSEWGPFRYEIERFRLDEFHPLA